MVHGPTLLVPPAASTSCGVCRCSWRWCWLPDMRQEWLKRETFLTVCSPSGAGIRWCAFERKEKLNNRWVACSVEKAKEYEQKHHVLHPTKEAALWSYRAAIEFEQKHQMVNRLLRGLNRVGSKEVCCQEARWLTVMPGIQQSDKDRHGCTVILNCCNVSFWGTSTFQFLLDETSRGCQHASPQHNAPRKKKEGTPFIMILG